MFYFKDMFGLDVYLHMPQMWKGYKIAILLLTGPLKPEITITYVAVSTIFFNSGLSLKTEVSFHNSEVITS